MRRAFFPMAALAALAACSGGDSGTSTTGGTITAPPQTPTVSTVVITPATAQLLAPATVQLTAVAMDGSGNTLTRSFTWTSSAPAVATVSASGLVTAVASGTATITAATDGRQGSAAITVTASADGPVVAKGDIGPSGGTLGTTEYGVTIPAGALASTATLTLVRDTVHPIEMTTGRVTPNYTISGLPSDREVAVRVRIKYTGSLSGVPAIAITQPSIASTDTGDSLLLASTLTPATDSAGYLVGQPYATIRPTKWLGEVSASWIAERHPDAEKPFAAPTALSWRDSLWGGLSGIMVSNSGYGKAPLMKYLTTTYGDAKVPQIYTAVKGGMNPVTAFLAAFPADREAWFNDFMKQHLGGKIYEAWPVATLMPEHRYNLILFAGRQPWETDFLLTLGVEGELLMRDTAKFGPTYQLPIFLDTAATPRGMVSLFRKTPNAGVWQFVSTGDTVRVPGTLLRSTDSLLMIVTNTMAVAPYNTQYKLGFRTDLSIPPGDLRMTSVSGLTNGIRFICSRAGDAVTFDPAENAMDTWDVMSQIGTWERTTQQGTPPYATYTWKVDPAYADSLRKAGITLQSSMTVGNQDTVTVQARFAWSLASALRAGGVGALRTGSAGTFPWWSLVAVAAFTPVLVRRGRGKRLRPVLGAMALLLVTACSVGLISLSIDEKLEYTFTKLRFTADPANPRAALLELKAGKGSTTLTKYQMEHWTYFTTAGKPDSAKSTCTGSGVATYTVDGVLYNDKVTPPSLRTEDARLTALGKAIGFDVSRASPEILMRLR